MAFCATEGPQGNYQKHPLKDLSNLPNVILFSDKVNSFSTEVHLSTLTFCLNFVSLTLLKKHSSVYCLFCFYVLEHGYVTACNAFYESQHRGVYPKMEP